MKALTLEDVRALATPGLGTASALLAKIVTALDDTDDWDGCPNGCSQDHIYYQGIYVDGTVAFQRAHCASCDAEWAEIYTRYQRRLDT